MERIIALGPPSATGLEELYKTGQLSRHEVQSRTIAERKKQAEKVRGTRFMFVTAILRQDRGGDIIFSEAFFCSCRVIIKLQLVQDILFRYGGRTKDTVCSTNLYPFLLP